MSDDARTPPPGEEEDRTGPFPESSLTPPDHPQADPPPEAALEDNPPAQPGAGLDDAPAAPAHDWIAPRAPEAPPTAPPPQPAAQYTAPAGPGLTSGDPLAGAGGTPAPSWPPGYTSPPPPGAGGPQRPAGWGAGSPPALGGRFVLAGWWRRVGAALIDGAIILVGALVIMAPLGVGLFSAGSDGGVLAFVAGLFVATLVVAVVALIYAPAMMGATNGKTLGRMATGIRVVRVDGRPITFGFAALREVAVKALLINGVGGSVTFGLAGLLDVLWPLWDEENRALHDFLVNTRTVLD